MIEIDLKACNSCGLMPEPPCVRVCPGDVIEKDFRTNEVRIRDVKECWGCYACVKVCPRFALEVKMPFWVTGAETSLVVKSYRGKSLEWILTDAAGEEHHIEFPTRALPEPPADDEAAAFVDQGMGI